MQRLARQAEAREVSPSNRVAFNVTRVIRSGSGGGEVLLRAARAFDLESENQGNPTEESDRRLLRVAGTPEAMLHSRYTSTWSPESRFFLWRFFGRAERRVNHRWLNSSNPLICGRMNLINSRKSSSDASTHTARSGQPSIAEVTRRLKSAA